jgi:Holliday junction resolvase RusA-like endonuclease
VDIELSIKPLSVNQAFKGRRFKNTEYNRYERHITLMLPKISLPNKPFFFYIEYGFSNSNADIDNPTKLILDILQKKYGFNDREIYAINLRKKIVAKDKEYIKIKIETYNERENTSGDN